MKLFQLVKEIRNREGHLYFKRWALIETNKFSIYLHHILRKDEDKHLHDHPWGFANIILRGTYFEVLSEPATKAPTLRVRHPLTVGFLPARGVYHKILALLSDDVWSLVVTGPRKPSWGYWIPEEGRWVESSEYRDLKRRGFWDEKGPRSGTVL